MQCFRSGIFQIAGSITSMYKWLKGALPEASSSKFSVLYISSERNYGTSLSGHVWLTVEVMVSEDFLIAQNRDVTLEQIRLELMQEASNLRSNASDDAFSNNSCMILIELLLWAMRLLKHHMMIFHVYNLPNNWWQSNAMVSIHLSTTILLSNFKLIA